MAQKTTGLHAILSAPWAYDLLQNLLGARKGRTQLIRDHIRPGPESTILDIGCGTGEIVPHLPKDSSYHGFDLSALYIDSAKRRFGHRATFHCMDIADYQPEDDSKLADVVLAVGILHHLDDGIACKLIEGARSKLKPGGRLITMDGTLVEGQSSMARNLILRDRGQNIRTPDGYRALAEKAFDRIQMRIRHDMIYVPYTHCIMECSA
ncbi:class I SAM-dependent methyltransferase [Xanthomonas floridensis]|uniref:Methyltransferase n=1 Tax=Xanthomonas floridensis TaxID=1843580 RepID=A0A1A9M8V2_9XANT|nr:class I SAM-dependent methyltransferase [Xanthomonas floridensis]MEA5122811.1 class I SAM-dependent methyltransferase [Xanthomonas floridensis]MEA5131148.1 class I SAM-dependent methyltransferase [Xanthomonas floridensis]OAG66326.1 methyltransferase [Xanthomonas floridensis]